ncbi:hypothetical protein Q5P01_008302 [Channa striata]|uniref:Uncharacterized protein n=1 Tax=Channa striata TaxID=64152 RepID=A0AA88SX62_CHASR|nr:hypothetical protein Q5P01_008302 [Channa striata]
MKVMCPQEGQCLSLDPLGEGKTNMKKCQDTTRWYHHGRSPAVPHLGDRQALARNSLGMKEGICQSVVFRSWIGLRDTTDPRLVQCWALGYGSSYIRPSQSTQPSINLYWNPALLGQLEKLSTLILDCNNYTSHVKFPYMPSVTTVCVNKNKINNLPVFVEEVRRKFPNIKILSMMNNEAAPSYFNGGSLTQYKDYRQYVISQIPGLEILDDTEVVEKERVQARKTYRLQQSRHSSRKRKDDLSRKH